MKKLLFTLAALLMASSAFAGHWVTFEAEDFDYTSGDIFVIKDGVVLEGYGRIDYDHFRFYARNNVTFTCDDGILAIEFTCIGEDDGEYGPGNFSLDYDGMRSQYTYEGNMGNWEDGLVQEGVFVPFTEETFEEGSMAPFHEVTLHADYQVRCTQINVYVLGDDPTPPEPTELTAAPTFNGYTTDGVHAYFVEIVPTEPSVIYYRVQYPDGTWTEWAEYEDILSFTGNGMYRVEAYAVADGKLPSYQIAYEFVVSPVTGLTEMVGNKTVASQRYFNVTGQEMSEANGLTIVVTTYADGTTNTTKVIK